MANMEINVRRLWDKTLWRNNTDNHNYSTLCEGYIGEILARKKQWSVDAITVGYDNRYDLVLAGRKVEVKVSSGYLLKIEYCRQNRKLSGISTTEADWYATLNTSRNGDGKLRLIPTELLIEQLYIKLEQGESRFSEGVNGEQGYYYVNINPYDDLYNNDGWVCNIPFRNITDPDGMLNVAYDLGPAPQEWSHSITARLHRELTVG